MSINHDKSREQQLQDFNWNTIVNAVGKDKVTMKGSRVVFKRSSGSRESYTGHADSEARNSRASKSGQRDGVRLDPDFSHEHAYSGGISRSPCGTRQRKPVNNRNNGDSGDGWTVHTNRTNRRNSNYIDRPRTNYT